MLGASQTAPLAGPPTGAGRGRRSPRHPEVTVRTQRLSPALLLGVLTCFLLAPIIRGEGKKVQTLGTIERKDHRFDKLIAPGAVLEKLTDGHDWTEGPVWVKEGGFLLFSDIPRNSIYKLTPDGHESLFLKPSGYTGSQTDLAEPGSNGLLIDPHGRLVLMEHGDRRVSRECRWTPGTKNDARRPLRTESGTSNSPNDEASSKSPMAISILPTRPTDA